MELNHQIRLCRPFPFRFGFRAIFHNVDIVSPTSSALQRARFETCTRYLRATILIVPTSSSTPPRELIKRVPQRIATLRNSN
jgi:hypothetical protein